MFCSNCGHNIAGISGGFCNNCGAEIESVPPQAAPKKKGGKVGKLVLLAVLLVGVGVGGFFVFSTITTPGIVGRWEVVQIPPGMEWVSEAGLEDYWRMTYFSDGTFMDIIVDDVLYGTWSVNGNQITSTIEWGESTIESTTTFRISGSILIFYDRENPGEIASTWRRLD
jgi:hypothetical protein